MSSMAYLVPMLDRDDSDEEFYKVFGREYSIRQMGYDMAFISDHYGLAPEADRMAVLQRVLRHAAYFDEATGISPKLVIDIGGWHLATDPEVRALAEDSHYIAGYHVFDEPDAHLTGRSDEVARTPEQIKAILGGVKYSKPLMLTFENQAGRPGGRQWNYAGNDDLFYLLYVEALQSSFHWLGIDYYLFSRSFLAPQSQLSQYSMMRYFQEHIGGSFAHVETTWQGLRYMRSSQFSRGPTSEELWAQIWLYWTAGQRHLRSDFNYVFWDGEKEIHDHNGLLRPENSSQLATVQRANTLQRLITPYLHEPAVHLDTTHPEVKCSGRVRPDNGNFCLMLVNCGSESVPLLGILMPEIQGDWVRLDKSAEPRKWCGPVMLRDVQPYEVQIWERIV